MSFFSDPNRINIEVDLNALSYNYQVVCRKAPDSKVMVILKANAYGHGLIEVAHTLSDCGATGFAVARLSAAIALRESGLKQNILLLSGVLTQGELAVVEQYHLDLVVHQPMQIRLLKKHLKQSIRLWLKFDSGMSRLGFNEVNFIKAYEEIRTISVLKDTIILMSHLACADSKNSDMSRKQYARCLALNSHLGLPLSLSNSAGILQYSDMHAEWVRPGIILYGILPYCDTMADMLNLKPVMTVKSRLLSVKQIPQGASVGYGAEWVAEKSTRIGVVACGYADGYLRSAQVGTPTLLSGQRCPLIGRVSMDMFTINLDSVPNAAPGDWVELFGQSLPIEEVAQAMGTIPYELCTAMKGDIDYLPASHSQSTNIN